MLADDQRLFREALRVVLEGQPDLTVVAEVEDGVVAVTEAKRVRPDVALLGVNLPLLGGIRATLLIKRRLPECHVLVVGEMDEPGTLAKALAAGASGYLTRESPVDELIHAIRIVNAGDTLIPQRMLGSLLALLFSRETFTAAQSSGLLARVNRWEKQVLALLAQGADNQEISDTLRIDLERTGRHVDSVIGKLGLESRLDAASFVMQPGVLEDLVKAELDRIHEERGAVTDNQGPETFLTRLGTREETE